MLNVVNFVLVFFYLCPPCISWWDVMCYTVDFYFSILKIKFNSMMEFFFPSYVYICFLFLYILFYIFLWAYLCEVIDFPVIFGGVMKMYLYDCMGSHWITNGYRCSYSVHIYSGSRGNYFYKLFNYIFDVIKWDFEN